MTHRTFNSMLFILVCGLAVIVWSCVDVNNTNLTTQDYHSLVRYVNVATDASTDSSLTVDGNLVRVGFGAPTAYMDIKSGVHTLKFHGSTQVVSFNTDEQSTVVIHSLVTPDRFLNLGEGDRSKNNAPRSDVVNVRFLNAAQGNPVTFKEGSIALASDVGYLLSSVYKARLPGAHTFSVVAPGSYASTVNGVQAGVVSRSRAVGSFELTLDNGLAYTIVDTSDNSQGFYTAVQFRVADSGKTGPVVYTADVAAENISIPDTRLSGANITPSVTTIASGTGSFSLVADSARVSNTDTLIYTIRVNPDSADPFTAADFDCAGGTVLSQTLATGAPTFLDTTLSGQWTLTPALFDSVMHGKIYVNFRTASHPAGAIRARIVPDSFSVNVFGGTWSDITLTDAIKDSLVAGKIYVNFSTANNPAGQIRGQIKVDPSKGQYGVASITTDSLIKGRVYTILATGTGKTLRLLKIVHRQYGLTKPFGELAPPLAPTTVTAKSRQ